MSLLQNRKNSHYHIFILVLGISFACQAAKPIHIALSRSSKNYINWLWKTDSTIIIKDLDSLPVPLALKYLKECDGLLLTGGEDVYPGWYGKEAEASRCSNINLMRDSLEMALIGLALEMKIPVLGICRGHQILNVFLKGKNIIDIPSDLGTDVKHQCEDYLNCFHPVTSVRNSYLSLLCKCDSSMVTSNHHQGIETLSPMLRANAVSMDGLVEGIEWANPENRGFLLGVQWHPERMENSNPLSGLISKAFITQATIFSNRNKKQ